MRRSHLLTRAGVALTALLYVVGCASKPKPASTQARPGAKAPAAVARKSAPHSQQSPDAGAAEAPTIRPAEVTPRSVAQHTELYAQNLESLLAKRAGGAAHVAPVKQPEPAPTTTAPAETVKVAANEQLKVELPPAPPKVVAEPVKVAAAPAPQVDAGAKPQAARDDDAQTAAVTSHTAPPTSDQLLRKLSTRIREYPSDVTAHLEYQLLQFLRDEPVPELASVAPLPAEDRELLTALLDGLSNFRNALRAEANMLQSKKVAPLVEMGDRLRGLGELNIPTAALCTKVDRFGVYDPMEPAQFHSGSNNEAVLYCEVANFSSQLNSARQWETSLKHEAVVYSETGLNAWTIKADTVSDVSRNRRHDFYVVRKLRFPTLPIGRYLLKVTVTDMQVSRVAEATVPIQVVAP